MHLASFNASYARANAVELAYLLTTPKSILAVLIVGAIGNVPILFPVVSFLKSLNNLL